MGGSSERKQSFVHGFMPALLFGQRKASSRPLLPHLSFSSPSLTIHFSTTPEGRATLTYTLCFHSPSLSPFAYVVNGGISQLIHHVYEWHRAWGEVGAPCQKWRASLLHALCLADPICPSSDGHKICLQGKGRLGWTLGGVILKHDSGRFQTISIKF